MINFNIKLIKNKIKQCLDKNNQNASKELKDFADKGYWYYLEGVGSKKEDKESVLCKDMLGDISVQWTILASNNLSNKEIKKIYVKKIPKDYWPIFPKKYLADWLKIISDKKMNTRNEK